MNMWDRIRTAVGYRLIVLGQAILPADLRQIERTAHRVGIDTMHEAIDAIVAERGRASRRATSWSSTTTAR